MILYAAADGPQVRLIGQTIREHVTITVGPYYGRILFRPDVLVQDCTFLPPAGREAAVGRGADPQ